jgi:uncharacterized protein
MKIMFFVLTLITFLVLPPLLVHATIIRFFEITSRLPKQLLLWSLLFLSFSFLLSALLLRVQANGFTQGLNVLASIWLGFFIYLFLASLLAWSIWGVGHLLKFPLNMPLICSALVLLAISMSIVGLWNAQHPKVKQVSVTLENLPDTWKNKKVIHLSDVHIGGIYNQGFLNKIIPMINNLKPDLILITGDLFDGMSGPMHSIAPLLNTLHAAEGIYFATGNHEGYLGLKGPLSILQETSIRVLDNEIINIEGLQIVGISFPEHNMDQSIEQLFSAEGPYDPAHPSILLYHTPTNIIKVNGNRGEQQMNTYWSPDTSLSFAKNVGIDLQLSGHTHAGQMWPFGYLTRLIFGKYHYGLTTEGTFNIYTSSGTGTWGPPMRTGCQSEIVEITLK